MADFRYIDCKPRRELRAEVQKQHSADQSLWHTAGGIRLFGGKASYQQAAKELEDALYDGTSA
jgi:hypothetical protein